LKTVDRPQNRHGISTFLKLPTRPRFAPHGHRPNGWGDRGEPENVGVHPAQILHQAKVAKSPYDSYAPMAVFKDLLGSRII